jgi:tetratricopeptide (TPR) repeat protein
MIFSIFALILASGSGPAYFQAGNNLYEQGNYQEAIAQYDSALTLYQASAIFYNRGNSYFKLGRVGLAIADYLRAWRLNPRDADINYNLEFARQFRVDKNLNSEGILSRAIRGFLTIISPPLIHLCTALLFAFFSIALALYLFTARRPLLFSALGIFLIFLYCLSSLLYWRGATDPNLAVVVVQEAILRAGPGEEYKEIAAVHDGLEAKIVEHRQDWLLLQIPGGLGGWVQQDAIIQVFK